MKTIDLTKADSFSINGNVVALVSPDSTHVYRLPKVAMSTRVARFGRGRSALTFGNASRNTIQVIGPSKHINTLFQNLTGYSGPEG